MSDSELRDAYVKRAVSVGNAAVDADMKHRLDAFMINALAEGQALTESGVNQMIHVEGETTYRIPEFTVSNAGLPYIQALEQAVLKTFVSRIDLTTCEVCRFDARDIYSAHAPDCIVPALQAKYYDG